MRLNSAILYLAFTAIATGCAHPLTIGPDIAKIERSGNQQPIDKHVAYYIAADSRDKAVTTPGGGGDLVTYSPYRDIETGYYKMLSNVFKGVTLLKTPNDTEAIGKNGVLYIITPEVSTDSSSPSPFTWPPTKFTVNLTCNIVDTTGKTIKAASVRGEGQAEYNEFKSDFSLSGRRATLDALLKMQDVLFNMPELRNP
ncbi:MAG: hypothetical protein WAV95_04090 [Azonexus sp.]